MPERGKDIGALETFHLNLWEQGADATVDTEKQGCLAQLSQLPQSLNPFTKGGNLGKIILRNRQVDEIALFGKFSSSDVYRGSALDGVNVNYILYGDIKGKKQLLEARLKVKRKGWMPRKVVEMKWGGGALAEKLNADSTINELLWQSLGKLSARDIRVRPDERRGKISIYVRDDRHVLYGKLPPFQMYEKIAEHIYALAGISKTVQPLKPRESIAAEQASAPSATKYCFKCGANMPQQEARCPKCGTKQD